MRYKETQHALVAIAATQGGYFTSQQALSIGYAYPEQTYHALRGNWERIAHGIYRLRDYPAPERDDLIILSLMSHNRAGEPQAIVSHETALAVHELGDANPARIHLTVPPGFRRQLPTDVILHRGALTEGDWEQREGYRVTTPLRTLRDIAASSTSWPFLNDAVRDALRRGMARRSTLLSTEGTVVAQRRLHEAVEAAERHEQKAGV